MNKNREPRFFYGFIVAAASFFIMTIAWGANRTIGVFLEPMIKEFGWTRAGISVSVTLSMLLTGVLGIVTGKISDRVGPRAVVTICGFFMGISYLLVSQINDIWQLYLFYGVVGGIGLSGATVPMVSAVTRWFVKRRGLMVGIVMAGPALGITTVPLAASWLISSFGWRTAYVIVGSAVLVLVILIAQLLNSEPAQKGLAAYGAEKAKVAESHPGASGFSLQEALHTRQFWILAFISFICQFNINVVMVHIVIYAIGIGVSSIVAAGILSITAGISIGGRIISGAVADRIGNRKTVIISLSLTLSAFLCLLAGQGIWELYLFAAIFGLGGWACTPVISIIIARLFGVKAHGAIFSTAQCFGFIGSAVGPVLAGYLFDVSDSYHLAFLVSAVVSIIALMLSLWLRPPGRGKEIGA